MEKSILKELEQFSKERDWEKFHTLENLAKSISIEAGELLECFQWDNDVSEDYVRSELADILTYSYLMCAKLDVLPESIIRSKLKQTERKYPIEKSYGVSTKHDKL